MAATDDKRREADEADEDAEESSAKDRDDEDARDDGESESESESEGDDGAKAADAPAAARASVGAKRDDDDDDDDDDDEPPKAAPRKATTRDETPAAKRGLNPNPPSESKSAASKDDDDDDDDEQEEEEEEERDDAAPRVAEALGVGESADEEEKAPEQEDEPAPNRAARRRDEAVQRRKRRADPAKSKASAAAAKDDADLPKDKNARAKELLLRRREEAGRREKVGSNLLPGEMVDDALARTTSAAGKWIRNNFNVIQWVVLAGLVGGGVFLYLNYRDEEKVASASADLASAVAAERGVVMEEDKRSDDEKEFDTTRIFKTPEERADTALASYNKVIDQSEGTGAAILAKLGQAGIYLEKKEWQPALEAFMVVAVSPLAAADPDVKGRALEGAGFAKEGKADLDGALQTFKELEAIDARGYKELAMYHQARIHIAKGEKEKAKDLLKAAREKLTTPSTDGVKSAQFLEAVVDETLRRLDPSAVPAKTQLSGPKGTSLSPEEIQRMFQKAQEEAAKKKAAEPHSGEEQP